MQLSFEVMYQACIEKDKSFEGLFFTAVKTTGIFCRPSCTARKPKKENVSFYSSARECILKGYRPCKTCRPLERLDETPAHISELIGQLSEDPGVKIKDADLLAKGLDPYAVRRWFLKNHGITFQAYQRMFRINSAFKNIQNGESVTAAAYSAGFESLSGFGESFKNIFGISPQKSRLHRIIDLKRLETPLGTMYACASDEGICLLEFTDRKMLGTEFIDLARRLNATIVQGENKHFGALEAQLSEYFEGERQIFSVPLHTPGSDFQRAVWQELQNVPFGSTASYLQQAMAIGRPDAVRAVASANGANRISILIPCHRVIGSDGSLTGYGGGIRRKQWLLEFEKKSC